LPEVEQSAAQPAAHSARRLLWLAVGIIVVAAGWRAVIAATMPCIARDSVTFCEYARDLGNEGWAYLRRPTTHQHPLFPLTVLATQRLGRVLGVADSPLTWQRSGQVVAGLAGLALVLLAGLLTRRLVRRVELPIDPNAAAVGALALAALLPLNIWLSAEVMSDQLHAAFYLLGAWAMLRLERTRSAALCGVAGALAYLTRPEGLVVILAALAALVALRIPWRRRLLGMFTLLAAFGVCASPYWLATGALTAKLGKNPLDWLRGEETVAAIPAAPWCPGQPAR
jgi:predicted membrane-bound dolichyl-phosphate-mannose-protein mannosyltransferase